MDATLTQLATAGFAADDAAHSYFEAVAEDLRHNGPYQVLHVLTKGDVTVLVEQNTVDGVNYPPVAVVEGPSGRVFASPDDTELVLRLVDEVS